MTRLQLSLLRRLKPVKRVLFVHFFRSDGGNEPVREWLRSFDVDDRKTIGDDIKTVELGWPIGMPLVRKMEADLWELRIELYLRIARLFFTVVGDRMVLLHGFINRRTRRRPTRISRAHA